MAASFLFALTFAGFLVIGARSALFTFRNNCPYTVWPGALTNAGATPISISGFEVTSQNSVTIVSPSNWAGRFWVRSLCSTDSTGKFTCSTADCGSGQIECNGAGAIPPASLAEFTLDGDNHLDFYDVSNVDGFNLAISITPDSPGCGTVSCNVDINANCPPELAVPDEQGVVIGCKSACLALNQPQYCCTGSFGTPVTCPPTQYSNFFKEKCPQAYIYAYDDKTSIFTCPSGANYLITICP